MRHRRTSLEHANLPVTYTRIYLEWAQSQGIDTKTLLDEIRLPVNPLQDPTARISLQDHLRLLAAIIQRSGNPGLGLALGWQLPLTAHGSLGYALLCCDTVGQALELLQQFWHLRGRGVEFSFSEQGQLHIFEFHLETEIPLPLKQVIFEFIMSGFYRGVQHLLGGHAPLGELWFDHAQTTPRRTLPDGYPPVHYNMPAAQIRFTGPDLLDRRISTANPEALSLAIAQCQRDYALLDEQGPDFLSRVRGALILSATGYSTPEELATQLHISSRTLRRRLSHYGSGYLQLLESARQRDARHLLENSTHAIQHIAELLGYTNPANFTRAFRRWTGLAPRTYREHLLSKGSKKN